MASAQERFLRYLHAQGLKMTRQRAEVVQAFLESKGHFSAEALLAKVRSMDANVGRTTVYRTLKLLVGSGLAETIKTDDGVVLYERRYDCDHHDHLVCEGCGANVEVVDPVIEKHKERLAQDHGFSLTRHQMYLYGLCPACQAKVRRGRLKD